MKGNIPTTLDASVEFGLTLLDAKGRSELATMGLFNPHMKYETDFVKIIGSKLGIIDGSNQELLRDIAIKQGDNLHFLEIEGDSIEPAAAMRILLTAMSEKAAKAG
ncbi:hypothetical protein AWB80_08394 [Caballeronia pedi]|uniref:Uncharacterized protein n=1 Tax=Caballeronia pedi TaxID=1777141 RepID=A0A158E745_9BURK|nr:hypothetical protein [Caballeronia pedi]SAL02593.1 hypothetical protein AWB80_08394 [Caballeronia pedi]